MANPDETQIFNEEDYEDPRMMTAACEYLAELQTGTKPDRKIYHERYSGLGVELDECLDAVELAHSLEDRSQEHSPELSIHPLGDFKIIREVGRGGMGIVYEAMQLSLGRRVALKVLPFAAALDARQLQRFQFEAQAAAQLHHSNIVPVYAVGCERGTHFYAMQLINGKPISEAIKELQESPSARSQAGAMTTIRIRDGKTQRDMHRSNVSGAKDHYQWVASLIAQIGDALEYAHNSGIIHRDIKPANLLLDGNGTVWVTDFGLAQIAANNRVTMTGDLLGTMRYMSPEQASGQTAMVNHRTDIYSLGATMYEMLTLQTLFPGDDRNTLLRQILNEEPRPPRQIDRAIPIELETIVMKSIATSASDRYATAGEFAADLRRFIEQRPILAKRPTVVDRVRKWARRHPSVIASILIVLTFGVIGLGIATAAISREKSRTDQAYAQEKVRAQEAEWRLKLAQRAADEMISLAENELSNNPFEEGLRQRLLQLALGYYQEFITAKESDSEATAELEQTRDRVKRILADLAVLQADRDSILLSEPDVLADIKATDTQLIGIKTIVEQHEEDRRSWFKGRKPNEHYEMALELAKQNDLQLNQTLTVSQRKRLRQIALQLQGARAFQDLTVTEALQLTNEQRSKIKEVSGIGSFFGPPGPPGPPPRHDDHRGPEMGEIHQGNPKDRSLKEKTRDNLATEPSSEQRGDDGQEISIFRRGQRFAAGLLDGMGPGMFPGRRGGPRGIEDTENLNAELPNILSKDQLMKWEELIGPPFQGELVTIPFKRLRCGSHLSFFRQ